MNENCEQVDWKGYTQLISQNNKEEKQETMLKAQMSMFL
jgi:hypothetical protein